MGFVSVYGVKLHLLCATNRVPLSYELTAANVAEVRLTEELLAEAGLAHGVARKLLGDRAFRGAELKEELAWCGIALATERAEDRCPGTRQQIEICFSSLKRVFGIEETLATTLVGLATRIAAKITAYTTLTLFGLTDVWGDRRGGSKPCGHEPNNTHLVRGR